MKRNEKTRSGLPFRVLTLTLALLLALAPALVPFFSALPVSADEEDEEDSILLDNCDRPVWAGWDKARTVRKCTTDKTQGAASTEILINRGDGAFVIGANYTPLDATGATALVMDLYVSDTEIWYTSNSTTLELTSSGKCDVEETSWELLDYDLVSGWNRLELPLGNGGCNLSHVNYMRMFTLSINVSEALILRFDNIHLAVIDFTAEEPDFKLGTADPAHAVPAKKSAEPAETEPAVPETEETEPSSDPGTDNVAAIALIAVGAVFVLGGAVLTVLHYDRRLTLTLLCLGIAAAVAGAVLLLVLPSGSPAGEPEETEPTVTEGETEPQTPAEPVKDFYPFNVGDQTGHPENGAAQVDVEALLKADPSFDTKQAYKVIFKPSGKGEKRQDAPTGLISTSYPTTSNIVADLNVLAYGASPDDVTDDTAAFRSAISALSGKGGGTLFIPAGHYILTDTLSVPAGVGLCGELEPGTANGTVLCVYGGKGKTDVSKSAIRLEHHASVKNLAFWYPEQTIVNGSAIPYPATIVQTLSEGVTVENVTFVNSYFCIDFAHGYSNNSLQYVRDIYGTPLSVGYENDISLDIGRIEHVTFSPDIWLNSGLPGVPNEDLLRTYLLRNAIGMIIERIDWTFYADITVEGYEVGVLARSSSSGTVNGHMYDFNLLDCYYCFKGDSLNWMLLTDSVLRAAGNDGATPLFLGKDCGGDVTLIGCTLETPGANAAVSKGSSVLTFTDCTLTSKTGDTLACYNTKQGSLVNTTVSDGKSASVTDGNVPKLPEVDYGRVPVTKPASDRFIDLTKSPYTVMRNTDITAALQSALDSLKETGGTVYLPAGRFTLSGHIDVWAGIELRGAGDWEMNMTGITNLYTDFGKGDPDGESLITLYDGSGLRGLSVVYPAQDGKKPQPYSFTVRGNGKNLYIVDVGLPSSWNGVDLATYRCDGHYIEYINAAVVNTGVIVGAGSRDGIVRDCHFTPNTWPLRSAQSWWGDVYEILMRQGRTFVVGESENEVLYHNFTYGAYEGLSLTDGAKNVFVLCHGVDAAEFPVRVSGNCTGSLVDCQLVNLNGREMRYFVTDPDFTGTVDVFNPACWGTTKGAFLLKGSGTVRVVGGQILAAGSPMCELKNGTAEFYGMINNGRSFDYQLGADAAKLRVSGNVFFSGLRIKNDSDGCLLEGEDQKN